MDRILNTTGSTARALMLTVGLAATTTTGFAGGSFEFLFSTAQVSDDSELFLNLAVGHYGFPRRALEPHLAHVPYLEADLPVVLFLAQRSGRPPGFIISLRADGLGWPAVFTQVGVPVTVLFEGMDRDPGPPYGRAWGYWKKHPHQRVELTHAQITGLARVQVGCVLTGVSAWQLAGYGSGVERVVADRKGRPFSGRPAGAPEKGHGKGHGKGKGHR